MAPPSTKIAADEIVFLEPISHRLFEFLFHGQYNNMTYLFGCVNVYIISILNLPNVYNTPACK